MTRETNPNTSFIGDFSNTGGIIDYPETDGSLEISELDDQIRDAKQMIYNTFKSCDGEVTATHTELNYVDGVEQLLALWLRGKKTSGLATATGDSGDPNTYTLTTGESHTLADGDRFTFIVDEASTDGSLLEVDSNTARNLVDGSLSNINAGDLVANQLIEVIYDLTNTRFQIIGGLGQSTTTTFGFTVEVYDTPGAGNKSIASDVDNVTVLAWGAGGAGGHGAAVGGSGSSGGGGGGAYFKVNFTGTASQTISWVIGTGGIGISNSTGDFGDNTDVTFLASTYEVDGGAGGGNFDTSGRAGGEGGSGASASGGTPFTFTETRGGDGGDGSATASAKGGGGGSAAGLDGPGNDGNIGGTLTLSGKGGDGPSTSQSIDGGASVTGGDGNDGDSQTTQSEFDTNGGAGGGGCSGQNTGGAGGWPGGGGGGSTAVNGSPGIGGAGADGGVILIY